MIKVSELLIEVSKIMKDQPDVVYQNRLKTLAPEAGDEDCSYIAYNQPACIVGVALHNLGLDIQTLKVFDTYGDSSIDTIIRKERSQFEVDDTQAVLDLKTIQRRQDSGYTWGECAPEGLFD